nr:glycosyltransferase [Sneathiella limimaris]
MAAFGGLLTGPLEAWDALICTSHSAKKTVERTLENYGEYLKQRFGGDFKSRIQLPVIPLGINCDDFKETDDGAAFAKAFRDQYGISETDIVFLYVGRLASHAKAHPLPMYQALQKAAERTDKKVHLVQAGWFASKAIEQQFTKGAAKFCPSVSCHFVDGRDPEVRRHIWSVADVFTSLSDNIQETFGITPVEAMAAGLPVVVTDWDGYRETVRDGIDGYLVRTTMPSAQTGLPLSYRYHTGVDHYDRYVGQVSLFTHVDSQHCAELYLKLIENATLRRQMGTTGQKRARESFDWQSLIPKYQDLWAELKTRRLAASIDADKSMPYMPLMDDPFVSFEHYPTEHITTLTHLSLVSDAQERLSIMLNDPLGSGVRHLLPALEKLQEMLRCIGQEGPIAIGELARLFKVKPNSMILYAAWLAKMDLVTIANAKG